MTSFVNCLIRNERRLKQVLRNRRSSSSFTSNSVQLRNPNMYKNSSWRQVNPCCAHFISNCDFYSKCDIFSTLHIVIVMKIQTILKVSIYKREIDLDSNK